MTDAGRNLLAAIRAGDMTACLPLSDHLEEQGHQQEAKRLRTRFKRYQAAILRFEATAGTWQVAMEQRLRRAQAEIEARGGTMAWKACEISVRGGREENMLLAYVERLLREVWP